MKHIHTKDGVFLKKNISNGKYPKPMSGILNVNPVSDSQARSAYSW